MSLPYYKRFPRDFLEGTIGLSFEVKGAYAIVLDLIYMRDGRLPDDARYIAGQLGCSVRKWTAIRAELVEAGKIIAELGFISNLRADYLTEETRKYQDKQAEISAKPRKNNDIAQPELSQPEPHQEPEEVDGGVVGAGDDWPATDHVKILVEAAHSPWLDHHKSLGLNTSAAAILAWKRAGAAWGRDVVPIIAAISRAHHEPITSWKFFNNPVLRSLAQARQVLTLPEVRNHERTRTDRRQAAFTDRLGDIDAAMVAAFEPEAG